MWSREEMVDLSGLTRTGQSTEIYGGYPVVKGPNMEVGPEKGLRSEYLSRLKRTYRLREPTD